MVRRSVLVPSLVTITLAFAAGCGGPLEEDATDIGTARSAALNGNALNGNALNGNGLYSNALTGAMLAPNPLTPDAIGPDAMAAITDPTSSGDLSRQLLKYTVSCALGAAQSFSFSWVDAANVTHDETYLGLLALGANWVVEALPTSEQEWVSACLISRVNYFGTTVIISTRGPNDALGVADDERSTYTMREGAFWGNVFTATPYAASCDDPANDTWSRSLYRDCAAGYLDGGTVYGCPNVQRLGACADLGCIYDSDHTYYTSCDDPNHGTTNRVATVFLHD